MNITIADHETLINETKKLKITNRKIREKRSINYIYSKNGKENIRQCYTQISIERERERERERESKIPNTYGRAHKNREKTSPNT